MRACTSGSTGSKGEYSNPTCTLFSQFASAARNQETGAQAEYLALQQKILVLRPSVLETLRRNGHSGSAFTLAEKYHDFESLAALCNKEVVYPPSSNPHLVRIQNYLDRFKDSFAAELYKWYIQHGQLRIDCDVQS